MNDYELRYLPLFYDDLEAATDYIAEELKNPQAAKSLVDLAEKAILDRLPFAEAFRPFPSVNKREAPYYLIHVKNYVIAYVVLDHKIMEVRRFLYNHRNKAVLLHIDEP
ncbi:MAG: type II toxin-antitoxin system RelE/ParE family toxin [Lachnospiraceae bacterium]|nr:type II toxin-antitoxin system RelE/ParE family toxin [Lachnospiraceae bacterium]